MSKRLKEKLTMAEFMSQLLAEVKAINGNLQSLAKIAETLERIEKAQGDFYAKAVEKGVKTRAV
jgi:ADP-dependent phosphofructokinase/glucokinase